MQWPYVLTLAYSIVLAFIYAVGQQSLEFMLVFTNILFPVAAGVTAFFSFLTLKKYGWFKKAEFSRIWLGFSLGVFLWFLGELTWAVYVLVLDVNPYPSLADGFYLVGYLSWFLALTLFFKMFQEGFEKPTLVKTALTTSILTLVAANLLLFSAAASSNNIAASELVNVALDVVYPNLDIALFFFAFAILLLFLRGKVGKAWFFLTLGIILNVIADLLFSYAELQGFYYEGHPFELFWLWGYAAFLLGFYIHKKEF